MNKSVGLFIQSMSVKHPPQNLSVDIRDFITLLQKSQANCDKIRRKSQSLDSDKLSIIYSASEPESSLADKENSHSSSNKSPPHEEHDDIDTILKEIKKLGLPSEQSKWIEKLQAQVSELRKTVFLQDSRIRLMENQFEQQKQGTDQILKALIKMDQAEKELWSNYSELSQKYTKIQQQYQVVKEQNQKLKGELVENLQDIQFMRKLVLVANENYQNIQKKCKNLEKSTKMLQRIKQQGSSPEITSRSTVANKKSSCSPSVSDRSNMSVHKGSFEDNYRKLVLRTLKSKAIR